MPSKEFIAEQHAYYAKQQTRDYLRALAYMTAIRIGIITSLVVYVIRTGLSGRFFAIIIVITGAYLLLEVWIVLVKRRASRYYLGAVRLEYERLKADEEQALKSISEPHHRKISLGEDV